MDVRLFLTGLGCLILGAASIPLWGGPRTLWKGNVAPPFYDSVARTWSTDGALFRGEARLRHFVPVMGLPGGLYVMILAIWGSDSPPLWLSLIGGVVGLPWLAAFFVIMFNRPKLFVPPVYRSAPGFIVELLRPLPTAPVKAAGKQTSTRAVPHVSSQDPLRTTALLEVARLRSGARDVLRSYQVLVDDQRVARLRRGGVARIDVEPGEHVLQIKIDWQASESIRFTAQAGDLFRFECAPGGKPSAVAAFSRTEPYILLRVMDEEGSPVSEDG
jgi:hypothetical protein